jgi:hypothetical protein
MVDPLLTRFPPVRYWTRSVCMLYGSVECATFPNVFKDSKNWLKSKTCLITHTWTGHLLSASVHGIDNRKAHALNYACAWHFSNNRPCPGVSGGLKCNEKTSGIIHGTDGCMLSIWYFIADSQFIFCDYPCRCRMTKDSLSDRWCQTVIHPVNDSHRACWEPDSTKVAKAVRFCVTIHDFDN